MGWLKRREFRSSCPEDSPSWSLRALMPKRSPWRVGQVDPLRLRLIKIAARGVELKTMIRLHLPTACPNQAIIQLVIERIIVGNARLEIRHLSPLRPPPQPGNNGPGPPHQAIAFGWCERNPSGRQLRPDPRGWRRASRHGRRPPPVRPRAGCGLGERAEMPPSLSGSRGWPSRRRGSGAGRPTLLLDLAPLGPGGSGGDQGP